jgi:hypothetical protein
MSWSDVVVAKEVERRHVVRRLLSVVHEQVGEMDGEEADRLLVYLALAGELMESVTISIRSGQSGEIITKALQKLTPTETPTR